MLLLVGSESHNHSKLYGRVHKYVQIFLFCLILSYVNAHAVGESAIITLEFPAGAENTGLGESGVSIANTVSSVFWNPANAASLYEETYVNFIYSRFHENLLPSLRIPDLYHDFTAFSTTLNNIFPFVDLGYAYFRNYLGLGENKIGDDWVNSSETVISNCLGIRGFDILSFGISFKRFDSRPGMIGVLE